MERPAFRGEVVLVFDQDHSGLGWVDRHQAYLLTTLSVRPLRRFGGAD